MLALIPEISALLLHGDTLQVSVSDLLYPNLAEVPNHCLLFLIHTSFNMHLQKPVGTRYPWGQGPILMASTRKAT